MSERLKVALVNQPWGYVHPPITRGGSIPQLLYEIARRLAVDSDVTYYTRNSFRSASCDESGIHFEFVPVAIDKLIIKLQDKVKLFPSTPLKPFWASQWYYPRYARKLAVSARRRGCQIVHLNNFPWHIPIVRRHYPGAKIVMHMHCEWLSQLDHDMVEGWLAQTDLVLGVSDFITQRVRRAHPKYADRCKTLYNGVFTDRFNPGDRASRGGVKHIVFVGRVAPEKGVHTLIEAFATLAKKYSRLHLDIVGPDEVMAAGLQVAVTEDPEINRIALYYKPGVYHAHLLDLVKRNNLTDQVTFHGVLGHTAGLVEVYQRGDIAVVPSIWDEPFGIPVIEAMSSGAPVIATRVGAFPELVRPGETGLLIDRANPAAIASAIESLIEDEPTRRRMGEAGRALAVEKFSWDVIVKQLRGHYQNVLSRPAV